MKSDSVEHFEARLYLGSRRGYHGEPFSRGELINQLGRFQDAWKESHGWLMPARVTQTAFVAGDYYEDGFEIATINYPRRPRTIEERDEFMRALQHFLLDHFGQNRITVVYTSQNYWHCRAEMLEAENAEVSHRQ